MTSRRRFLNATMVLGGLIGAGLLAWSITVSEGDEAIPARPQLKAVHVTPDGLAAEPLPRIRVPELTPQAAPEPDPTGTEVRVLPRPRPVSADLEVPDYPEALPTIKVPELRQPIVVLLCAGRV